MAFCKNCGAKLEDGVKFCAACGTPVEEGTKAPETAQPTAEQSNENSGSTAAGGAAGGESFADRVKNINNTKDSTGEFDPNDVQQNKVMALLAYLSWLILIPLFAAKESKFARFHCNQGIVLAIAEIVAWVLFGILSNIPYVGWIFAILNGLVSLVCFIFAVLGIMNAVNGQAKELPYIGKFRILKY